MEPISDKIAHANDNGATTGEPVVRFTNVVKKIGRKTIIEGLTLDVPPGQVFGFLGPNGSGKTTTIRMMTGLMKLTAGDIAVGGHSIARNFEQAITQVGAIVENPEMYSYLSGYANLRQYARMRSDVSKERIDEVVRFMGLQQRIHDKVSTYSLGMRQRLGVAQAILHRPKLLILDEPTNGLDPQGIRELRDYLRELTRREGTTVFVSSHLLSEMELMCDSVAIIQAGKLIDVRQLNAESDAETLLETIFDVEQIEEAIALLEGGEIREGRLVVRTNREGIAEINARLVQAGIAVYGIRPQKRSLEDQFLEMTGGGQIV
ncbi:ABC transporter ATP-binding protein [Saccharibacillus endophyticus]|uniref:ABC transporter ATP-binding protein YhcH n=1 Tax=Saccharibacillus endophyticus TaxID=2060666 RepID=A0ABQ1ZU28_9BACL|nr:ABC transporter ATP-binding protein [Saccharibacillus endophyticus]GGH76051.1 putative ABC transporter ATP-binding protein YhcH [Saccharibacillus endophyticus]